MAPRNNIGLEMQAFPQLEAIGESLSAPVIWKGDQEHRSIWRQEYCPPPCMWDPLTKQQHHVLLLQGLIYPRP